MAISRGQPAGAGDDWAPAIASRLDRGPQTAGSGWTPLTIDESRYVIAICMGPDQSGKTHFAFSAPEPLLCLTFDPGNIRRGVARAYQGKNIQLATFELPKGLVASAQLKAQAAKETARWEGIYREAVEGSYFKSIVIDREDETWELFRYDEFTDGKAKGHHYTPLNAHYKGLLKLAEKHKKNLIMIGAVKDEWRNEKPTGKMIYAGFKHLGMLAQLRLQHHVDERDGFSIEVERCRDDATKNGEVITKESISQAMEAMGYEYPVNEAGEPQWFKMEFSNVMSYLIGGRREEWT